MGIKLTELQNSKGNDLPDYQFYCPGCKCHHGVWTTNRINGAVWKFDNNMEKPTFSPSLLVRYPYKGIMKICHTFIRKGTIQYLTDCTHELAGKTIDMEDVE